MSRTPNELKVRLASGAIDFSAHVFQIILMRPGFTFNRATHANYAQVVANELADGNGYNLGGETLLGVAVTQDNVENAGIVTWDNMNWTAAGANLEARGAIIYDDTHADDAIICWIDFGETLTILDGGNFTLANIFVALLDRVDLES
jgi:hypothetical protein